MTCLKFQQRINFCCEITRPLNFLKLEYQNLIVSYDTAIDSLFSENLHQWFSLIFLSRHSIDKSSSYPTFLHFTKTLSIVFEFICAWSHPVTVPGREDVDVLRSPNSNMKTDLSNDDMIFFIQTRT